MHGIELNLEAAAAAASTVWTNELEHIDGWPPTKSYHVNVLEQKMNEAHSFSQTG